MTLNTRTLRGDDHFQFPLSVSLDYIYPTMPDGSSLGSYGQETRPQTSKLPPAVPTVDLEMSSQVAGICAMSSCSDGQDVQPQTSKRRLPTVDLELSTQVAGDCSLNPTTESLESQAQSVSGGNLPDKIDLGSITKLSDRPGSFIRYEGRNGETINWNSRYKDVLIPVLHNGAIASGVDKCEFCRFHLDGTCRRSRCTYAHSWGERAEWICPKCTDKEKTECDFKWEHILQYKRLGVYCTGDGRTVADYLLSSS